MTVAYLCKE